MAADSPPLDPPGERSRSHGLRVRPCSRFVGLVGHQELRAVGRAQNQRSRRAQPRHHHRILARNLALVQQAADLALAFRRVAIDDFTVTGRPNSGLRAVCRATHRCLPRPRPHALRIEVGERIERGIQPLDLPDVRFGQLDNRDLRRRAAVPVAAPPAQAQHRSRSVLRRVAVGGPIVSRRRRQQLIVETVQTAPARRNRSDRSSSTGSPAPPHRPGYFSVPGYGYVAHAMERQLRHGERRAHPTNPYPSRIRWHRRSSRASSARAARAAWLASNSAAISSPLPKIDKAIVDALHQRRDVAHVRVVAALVLERAGEADEVVVVIQIAGAGAVNLLGIAAEVQRGRGQRHLRVRASAFAL